MNDQINNDVKLTKNVTIKPLETIETTEISNVSMSSLSLSQLISKEMKYTQYQVIIF